MAQVIKIGTRESELAVWQAKKVQSLLLQQQLQSELVFIKSEGDINLTVPLYEIGVQGIFTKSLDIALLEKKLTWRFTPIKMYPPSLPKDWQRQPFSKEIPIKIFLFTKQGQHVEALGYGAEGWKENFDALSEFTIATSSIRRKAQWLHRYPHHRVENLRGNVNSRLRKLAESDWHGAIFAAAGLERINVRPETSIDLD